MSDFVSVAVPVPLLPLLTYRVPPGLPVPAPGSRVLVPLGPRVVTGCVIDTSGHGNTGNIKDVVECLDPKPLLPPAVLRLALWVSEYYACGPGEAIAAAMPPLAWVRSTRHAELTEIGRERLKNPCFGGTPRRLLEALMRGRPMRTDRLAATVAGSVRSNRGVSAGRRATQLRAILLLIGSLDTEGLIRLSQPLQGRTLTFKTVRVAHLTVIGRDAVSRDEGPRLGVRQRDALTQLMDSDGGVAVSRLAGRGVTSDTLRRLVHRGLVEVETKRVHRDPFSSMADQPTVGGATLELTAEQRVALDTLERITGEGSFRVALIHGVTGSGKTEVYLRLADTVHRRGRRVLVLVPEIALTPAIARVFRHVFGDRVAIQHSGLSSGERHDQWHRIQRGEVDVVVGTRSAVFAPLDKLGLIIVDEEHDSSYKQEENPRYHGRDAAIVRGKQANALVVLGSATPSMESYHNVKTGRYACAVLRRRVFERPLATVRIVDMREELAAIGPDVVLSRPLRDALAIRLERQEQALILLNRRGFAAAVFCRQCGRTLECPNCSISLTLHRAAGRARCHYCNYSLVWPKNCPHCAGPYLQQAGFGTERIEVEITREFPSARVARLDRDTVRRRGALQTLLARFEHRDLDVLVGTQMIAKGHDFPNVTLVGVVSADVGLSMADFRSSERTFQLLTQVAGRAGRGDQHGEAIIQTLYPDHYSIRFACQQDYEPFFKKEIRYRQAMRYPPILSMINAIVRAPTLPAALDDAAEIVADLRSDAPEVLVLGPAPAPIPRLRGQHRAQIFLKGEHRQAMREALLAVLADRPVVRRRVTVDVDPLNVL